jgi:hypothetical protein
MARFRDQLWGGSAAASRPGRTAPRRARRAAKDGGGELLVCPICFQARGLEESAPVDDARLAGATPLSDWIGDEAATVLSW